MRVLWPLVPLAAAGCGVEYGNHSRFEYDTSMPPLEREPYVDTFVQTGEGEVDVLWVVDDSYSMDDEQEALAEYFPAFHEYFQYSGLDYHIGVVSTDMDSPHRSGRLVDVGGIRYIDPDTPDARAVFEGMALLGTNGSFVERGLDAVYAALVTQRDGHNAGFLRETSGLHVIVVSDEADFSTDVSPEALADFLLELGATREVVTFSSIVPSDTTYVTVTEKVGGIHLPIHGEPWFDVLDELGIQASGLSQEFQLTERPVPASLDVEVSYRGALVTFDFGRDWVYVPERNSIRFVDYVPPPFAEVRVTYDRLDAPLD